jgi:DNA (cytosine-5)-methyltransferase 1
LAGRLDDRGDVGDARTTALAAQNQRGELRTSDVAMQLTTGGGKPGQGYPAVMGASGVEADDPLLPLGLDSHRYRCCGNGVVAPVAEWLGVRLRDYFR